MLVQDAASSGFDCALLAVLPPGHLVDFDGPAVVRRAEDDHGVILRVTSGARELLHEAISAGTADVATFRALLPRAYAEALRDIRVSDETIDAWAAIAGQWS